MSVLLKVLRGERPSRPMLCGNIGFDDDLWKLIQNAWAANPKRRPPLSELLQLVSADPSSAEHQLPHDWMVPKEGSPEIWYDCENVESPAALQAKVAETLRPKRSAAGLSRDERGLRTPILASKPRGRILVPKPSSRPSPSSASGRPRRIQWVPKVAVKVSF
jgi:hypothetical protein